MKGILTCLAIFVSTFVFAQPSLPEPDKSALDVSYCPANFPLLRVQQKANEPLVARVIYSRPAKSGRTIFGDLIEYGKLWRLGANEATELEFYQPVVIAGNRIKKGRYTIYTIPNADKWTLILNKETDIWGSFKYDPSKDVLRLDVPAQKQTTTAEFFTIVFDKTASGYDMCCYWDDLRVALPIALK